jgi:hypothetical protein
MGHIGTSDFLSLVDYDEYKAHFAFLPKCGVEPVFQFGSHEAPPVETKIVAICGKRTANSNEM